jgi:hypothetical protein
MSPYPWMDSAGARAAIIRFSRKEAEGTVLPPPNFLQYSLDHGLGNAVTPKFGFQHYQVQAFDRGIVFAPDGQPTSISHLLW